MRIKAGQALIDTIRGKKGGESLFRYFSKHGFLCYVYNYWFTYFPSYRVRHCYLKKILGVSIGRGSFIHMGCYFGPGSGGIFIGENSVIGRNVDIIGDVTIGSNCAITAHSILQSASHYKNSNIFAGFVKRIIIEDYVWIGIMSIVLPGVLVRKGAIVGAHSTVSRNVSEYEIVAGSPAKVIGMRDKNACKYILDCKPAFN